MSPSLQTMGFFMSDINFCNTKEQLNHLGEVVTGKVDGSPTGADIDTSTLPYTGQVRNTLPALEELYLGEINEFIQESDQVITDKTDEFDTSIANKEAEANEAIDSYRLLNKGPYASGITLESKFEFITYDGESYFATNPPYTTTATTPDADSNLFAGDYASSQYVDLAINIGSSLVAGGVIFPSDSSLLSMGTQSTTVSSNANIFNVDTSDGGKQLYLWERGGILPSAPFTIESIQEGLTGDSLGGYVFTIDGNDYTFLTSRNHAARSIGDPIGWGAIPDYDGTNLSTATDNRASIQAALENGGDMYWTTGGYVVEIGDDDFNDTLGMRVQPFTTMHLGQSIIKLRNPKNLVSYRIVSISVVNDVTIYGGTIIGDRDENTSTSGEAGFGVFTREAYNITVRDTKALKCWGDSFYIGGSDRDGIYNIRYDSVTGDLSRRQGLSITSGHDIKITNSTFKNTSGTGPNAGIDIEPNYASDPAQTVDDITIHNCTMTGNLGCGLIIFGGEDSGIAAFNITVSECTIIGNADGAEVSLGKAAVRIVQCKNVNVINNIINRNNGGGVIVRVSVDDIDISGNLIMDNDDYGISLEQQTGGVTVARNIIKRNSAYAVRAITSSSDVDINDNDISDHDEGFVLSSTSEAMVSNNRIKRCTKGGARVVNSANDNTFSGNKFIDCATDNSGDNEGAVVGIFTASSRNVLKDNRMIFSSGNQPDSYYRVGTNGTDDNKFIYDILQDPTVARLTFSSGSPARNEVVDINGLLSNPIP